MSLKRTLRRIIDRPGGRWLLSLRGSVLVTWRNRRLCRARYDGERWVHRHRDGVLVNETLTGLTPAVLERLTEDICFHAYQPGAGDVVVDVGAGIGTEVAAFARRVGPRGRVFAVEAHPRTFACLERTIRLNGLHRVTPLPFAVADRPGELRISDLDQHLANTVLDEPAAGSGTVVRAVTIDQLAREHGLDRIDYLKMNIEGAERLAIRGMTRTIRRTRHVCISCHDFKAERTGIEAMRTRAVVRAFLEEHGFAVVSRPADPRPYVRDYLYGTSGRADP